MTNPSIPLISFLYEALDSPLGIVVESESPDRLRQKLYPIRKEHIDLFGPLSFILSPLNPSHLWIIKQPETSNGSE